MGCHPLLGLLTVPWNSHASLGVSFHLLIEDQGLVLSAILVPFDSNGFYVVSLGYVILSKVAGDSQEGRGKSRASGRKKCRECGMRPSSG